MNLKTTYMGGNDPFEGDLKIWLRSLPEGASVTRATVTLEPVRLHGSQEAFQETFVFDRDLNADDINAGKLSAAAWGVLKNPTTPDFFVEVDFHARRRLAGVKGSGGSGDQAPKLSVDLGGAYIAIADDGTFLVPDKKEWRVKLSPTTEAPLPGLIVNRFMLTGTRTDAEAETTGDQLVITEVSIISVPTNISLRLGNMPPFWIHTGDMVVAATSTDFADVLKAYLAGAQVEGGFYAVPLIVHSDSISRFNVTISIDYVIQQSVLPSHLPEATLPYGFSSLPGTDDALMTATLPRGAVPLPGTGGKIKGTFDASRVVFGFIGESGTTDLVDIHPGRTLAQPILVDKEISVSAIDLPLGNTETGLAGLNLALQDDADGKPSGTVLISADISVERPIPGGPAWGSAKLPSKFRFLPGVRYWLTIQIITGNAYWETIRSNIGTVPLQSSSDGGISWNNAATQTGQGPLQATFRLRHIPTKFSVPVQLQIGKGPDAIRTCFDQFAPLGRVDFNVDFTSELCNYLAGPAGKSPCSAGDLIINGGFEMPQYDDATFKLFGFYSSVRSNPIKGNVNLDRGVDLSIQRFIQLAVDNSGPIRIDCAGKVPSRTRPEEIVSTINKAMGKDVASYLRGSLKIKGSSSVRLLFWCSQQIYGWEVKSGSVVRIKAFNNNFVPMNGICAVISSPPKLPFKPDQALICLGSDQPSADQLKPTVLSQDIFVSSGCNYLLSFQYVTFILGKREGKINPAFLTSISNAITLKQPYWEIIWLDAKGLKIKTQSSNLDLSDEERVLNKYEIHLTAPTGAVKASLHFIQSPIGVLLIDDVSFKPTLDTLDNGGFLQWIAEEGDKYPSPSGWSHSGSIDPIDSSRSGVKLNGDGVEDAILTQTTEVIAGKRYTLKIEAWPDSPSNAGTQSIEERARAELRWLTDGTAAGNPVILPLDGRDFPEHSWAADVPAGINQAEIRLIEPKSNNVSKVKSVSVLNVKSVSLEESDTIAVPLIFLSEAPGELTVSNLHLVYDLPTSNKLQ